MTSNRDLRRLARVGRRLASNRDDLIAAGADPADLPIPLIPIQPRRARRTPRPAGTGMDYGEHLRQMARVWLCVAVACLGAFAGCVSATGAMLMVNGAMTWHSWVATIAGLGWALMMLGASAYGGRLRSLARDAATPAPEPEETES